jgi:hypothetical protein
VESDEDIAKAKPLDVASRPLMGSPGEDVTYAAVGGSGMMALALARGLRSSGWTRLVSIVVVVVAITGLLAIAFASIF